MGLLTVALMRGLLFMTWVDDDDGVIDVAVAAAVVDVVERNGFFCFVVVVGC